MPELKLDIKACAMVEDTFNCIIKSAIRRTQRCRPENTCNDSLFACTETIKATACDIFRSSSNTSVIDGNATGEEGKTVPF